MQVQNAGAQVDLRKLYNSLSDEARSAIDDRALSLRLAADANANLQRLERGEPIVVHQGSVAVGFEFVERALQEALDQSSGQQRPPPAGTHKPHQQGVSNPNRFYRARELGKFLVRQARQDIGVLGDEKPQPRGEFKTYMIHRGSLACGADFEAMANKANPAELWIRTTVRREVKHYGPFDASILPWESSSGTTGVVSPELERQIRTRIDDLNHTLLAGVVTPTLERAISAEIKRLEKALLAGAASGTTAIISPALKETIEARIMEIDFTFLAAIVGPDLAAKLNAEKAELQRILLSA